MSSGESVPQMKEALVNDPNTANDQLDLMSLHRVG